MHHHYTKKALFVPASFVSVFLQATERCGSKIVRLLLFHDNKASCQQQAGNVQPAMDKAKVNKAN
jgi:hypothetical protein